MERISRGFKDINLSFDPHPVTKDIQVLRDESAIRRSVRNIVQTIPTEKFFNSLFGSDVRGTLFDFIDFGSASTIADQIEVSINKKSGAVKSFWLLFFISFNGVGCRRKRSASVDQTPHA